MVEVNDAQVAIYIVFLTGSGLFMLRRGVKKIRLAGRAADTAPSKVRSVAIGFAELKGNVESDEVLIAPLSGRPCTYYLCEIERYERAASGRSRETDWQTKWKDEQQISFSLSDGTGSIALMSDQAEFDCVPDRRWYLPPGNGFTVARWQEHDGTLLDIEPEALRIQADDGGPSRIGSYRFTERIIAPDEPIYVLGTVKREDDVFVGLDQQLGPFVISDRKEAEPLGYMRQTGIELIVSGIISIAAGVGVLVMALVL